VHTAYAMFASAVLATGSHSIVSSVTKHRQHIGQCFSTRVLRVENRLVDGDGRYVPNSGSAIAFADGHYNVSYDQLKAIDQSRPGDRVSLCVISIPRGCPSGDTRGIGYRGKNLRTGLTWRATDTEHLCGGA